MPEINCPFVFCKHNNQSTSTVGYCKSSNVAFKSVLKNDKEYLDCLCFEYEENNNKSLYLAVHDVIKEFEHIAPMVPFLDQIVSYEAIEKLKKIIGYPGDDGNSSPEKAIV